MSETVGVCESCNNSADSVLHVMLPVLVNIFLNTYTMLCNDNLNAKGGKKAENFIWSILSAVDSVQQFGLALALI